MTDLVTRLRQSLNCIKDHADVAISAIDHEDDEGLLLALGEMDATNHAIRSLVTARVDGHA